MMRALRWRRLPVRWRLSAWYALLLAGAFVLLGAAIFIGLRFSLYEALDEQLEDQTALTLATIQEQGGTLRLVPGATGELETDEHFLRLVSADGAILIDTSDEIGSIPLDPALFAGALSGRTTLTSARARGETVRIVTAPVTVNGRIRGVLQVGMSREEIDESLRTLVLLFGIAGPLVLLIAVAGGYALAGRAMAPVADITRLAASVDAGDLDARLNLDLPDDELGRLAATFDLMLGRIGESFERQRRFTGDAAHELRTPLSLMRSRVDLALMESPPGDPHAETFQDLQNDLDRLTGLVGSLLTLARADARELALDRTPLDLAGLIETTVETFQPRFAETGVALRLAVSPCTLAADADLLVQVLVNLIANALTHTPPGGTIEAGCRCDGGEALIWVADTGGGIAPEHRARVFDRFYRVDPGRARAGGGAGLGLSISRAIVEAHGGRITLESEHGHGTRIEVVLPVSSLVPNQPNRIG